jgi:2-polyprenyl-6-hydroxyphenyl methylase/3-demethylubiquinone-9 3-methyltransferase
MVSLKASAEATPCPICTTPAPLFGAVDFNTPCRIPDAVTLPPTGAPVAYCRCTACGFLFTDAFGNWSHDDFKTHIYNDDYILVDPEYLEIRPRSAAGLVINLFGEGRAERRVLDFGGGNDAMCANLRAAGFPLAITYDPFVPAYAQPPEGTYDLITCFETLEHMPDPVGGIGLIVEKLADPGVVLFSTLLQPPNFEALGMNWWYVGPRNGHVSLFSQKALVHAWGRHGCRVVSFNHNLHMAFRTLPDFVARRLK